DLVALIFIVGGDRKRGVGWSVEIERLQVDTRVTQIVNIKLITFPGAGNDTIDGSDLNAQQAVVGVVNAVGIFGAAEAQPVRQALADLMLGIDVIDRLLRIIVLIPVRRLIGPVLAPGSQKISAL